MKLAIMSDLHLEFNDWTPPAIDADVVVIAGDTHPGVKGVIWASEHFKNVPVIMICGNHEFYGKRSVNRHPLKMKEKAAELSTNIHVLQNETITIDGQKFACGTLWTDYKLFSSNQPLAMLQAENGMNDYKRCVYNYHTRLTAPILLKEHLETKDFLEQNIDNDTVVVTHHAPTEWHLASRTQGLEFCYASDLYPMISHMEPKLWISGHTHYNVDFKIGKTRLVANCRGYTDEEFQPLIIEI